MNSAQITNKMSSFHIIEDVQEQTNSTCSTASNSSMVRREVGQKRIRTIGNFDSNGIPLSTTATSSSAKVSVTSTAKGKSVVSSFCMSMERKDSIQYMPRKIAPCITPAGQSTVIHLDNYTHFMAQRVTTTKTAIKRAEIISNKNSNTIGAATTNTNLVDVDLKVVFGGVTSSSSKSLSSCRSNNKTKKDMNKKEKKLGPKSAAPKLRGRKNFLPLEPYLPKELEMVDIQETNNETPPKPKGIHKKPNVNRVRKVIKPRQTRKTKANAQNAVEISSISSLGNSQAAITPTATNNRNQYKILKPCVCTQQSKKCPSEMTCQYLHSDFPCKYYYLNLNCPKGFNCQFMHNGPLEPQLMEALRSHILELLSMKPTALEIHFVQQLHNIEDLTQRLQSFVCKDDSNQSNEIIEVLDYDGHEDQVLVVDESGGNNDNEINHQQSPQSSLANPPTDYSVPIVNKYDNVYENFKQTNNIIDEMDQKLRNLKTTSNMTANEKIPELQKIYEVLKEQEKRLPYYENLNMAATAAEISTICTNINTSSSNNDRAMTPQPTLSQTNVAKEHSHIVLVNPEIVNEIQISLFPDNNTVIIDDENCIEDNMTDLKVPQGNGMQSHGELVAQQNEDNVVFVPTDDVRIINNNNLTLNSVSNNELMNNGKEIPQEKSDQELILNQTLLGNEVRVEENGNSITSETSNMNCEDELPRVDETSLDVTNLSFESDGDMPIEGEEQVVADVFISEELLDKTSSPFKANEEDKHDESMIFNNTLLPHNETLELDLTPDEKGGIESYIGENKTCNRIEEETAEEESPPYEEIKLTKPEYINRIRLRSHAQQDNAADTPNSSNKSENNQHISKSIKSRRLRLPKPNPKTCEKTNNFDINADIINKLINSSENPQGDEGPIETTQKPQILQNVILTKRFMKRAKAKLEQQQTLLSEATTANNSNKGDAHDVHDEHENVEQNMFQLHKGEDTQHLNGIENIDVTLLTQNSEESNNSLNPSQEPLIVENDCEEMGKSPNELPSSSNTHETCKILNKQNKKKVSTNHKPSSINKKRHISFENSSSSSSSLLNTARSNSPPTTSSMKAQMNLGNPQIVLTKRKLPFVMASTKKLSQADSTTNTTTTTTTNVNNYTVTSSTLLADEKQPAQKRHSFTLEYDLDASLKDYKCLKIDNTKSGRKVNFENRRRTYSEQSSTSKDVDFDTDSCDEKLTIADTFRQTAAATISSTRNERNAIISEPLTTTTITATHIATHCSTTAATMTTTSAQLHGHKEKQENESDLRQQIENVSNKSDLKLQTHHQEEQEQQQQQQQKQKLQKQQHQLHHEEEHNVVERTKATTTTAFTTSCSITKSSHNLPHKQYQHENNNKQDYNDKELQLHLKQCENNLLQENKMAKTSCNPCGNSGQGLAEGQSPSSASMAFERIAETDKPDSNSSNIYSNEHLLVEQKEDVEYSTYSSLYNKLSAHSTKCQINFENSSVNITPISSPTYGDDTIASPSPVRRSMDFRLGGEIDGRLTYPPIPYILHSIDLAKVGTDKLEKTIQLDPRIFRTQSKKQLMVLCKPAEKSCNNASNATHLSYAGTSTSFAQPSTTSMVSAYDPRNRMTEPMTHQTAAPSSSSSSPSSTSALMHPGILNAVPLALKYHSTSQPTILQPQQQQTPNIFLYGCLQRSPWYQSLMSTMKIQINQSISQLVRALNNFHRERLLNPEMVFDVFKIDCAGELLEIMRNLGIFVNVNGIINEQRHVPTFGGRSCCNTMPVNATYSFIQQVLTPNTHCTSLTTSSSTYNAADGSVVGTLNVSEPFVSCYIKSPEPPAQKHYDNNNNNGATTQHNHYDDNSSNRTCNNKSSSSNNSNSFNNGHVNDNNNHNNNDNYYQQNSNSNRRYGNQFKKPYDNNYGNNNYQQRSSYSNNPRFSKPGCTSPTKSNATPPNSPRGGGGGGFNNDGNGNSYGSRGGAGGGYRGGRGGGFNRTRRFNNYNDNNYNNNGGSSWSSASDSNDKPFNKYQNNSPTRCNSPPGSSSKSGSPRAVTLKTSSPPPPPRKVSKKNSTDEECWDSDN